MDERHLRAFLVLAEELNFGRAAERLHVAQPWLSKLIRQLEGEVSASLFTRSTRAVALTPAGVAFGEHAREAVTSIDDARSAVRAALSGTTGTVSIGYTAASATFLVPDVARVVRDRLPDVRLRLIGGAASVALFEQITSGDLDLAFVHYAKPTTVEALTRSGFGVRPLWAEPLGCGIAAVHRLAGQQLFAVSDLAGEPFVGPSPVNSTLWPAVLEVCGAAGFVPKLVQTSNNEVVILTLAAAGIGVTIMPVSAFLVTNQPGLRWALIDESEPSMQTALVWNSARTTAATRAVLELTDELDVARRAQRDLTSIPRISIR